ncbi:MAG: TetR/AcrR family transcriptional regulator [Candidatus Riflebacteria bacterium]|nr:TetR/AcrR family transcriptional regulator [Candidatus Riflebacteria bacterium]
MAKRTANSKKMETAGQIVTGQTDKKTRQPLKKETAVIDSQRLENIKTTQLVQEDGERIIVRRKSGVQRSSQILETARDLIFNEGFSNFTIREVAGRIGISEAAIYRHFSSKEELMLALLGTLFTPWREAISQLVDEKIGFGKKLEELFQLHLHHLLNERLNPILFLSEAVNPQNQRLLEVMRHNINFLQQSVASMVKSGQKKGHVKANLSPEALAAAVIGLLQTAVIKWTLQRSSDGLLEDGARNMAEMARLIAPDEVKR